MTQAVQKLIPQLAELTVEERAKLACYLLESLRDKDVPGDEEAFDLELTRRLDDLESGRDPGQSGEAVIRELRGKA